ncbi:MAG: putative 4-hydroxybenzoate polyprenyltransferase [Chitinophagales bacterium]|nr:putative 4-hydroxybenzoate polyprenyltransferase [Chitinophagales bacterium]
MKKYFSLIKFSHTIFALPFAMIGFFLAVWHDGYPFSWIKFLLVVASMIFARSAAMGFNRIVDAGFDGENPRTVNREIPTGLISKAAAISFVNICCIGFVTCSYFINSICFFLSPVALLIVLGYSYTKRFTALSHFILGLGLSLAPIGAYLAVAGEFNLAPVLFGLAVLFWVGGFDIIYALQDTAFDKSHNLFSLPSKWGKKTSLWISMIVHAGTIISLSFIGIKDNLGMWYWIGLSIFTLLLLYQHSIVKSNDLSRINIAFFTTNGIASIVFSAFVLIDLFQ